MEEIAVAAAEKAKTSGAQNAASPTGSGWDTAAENQTMEKASSEVPGASSAPVEAPLATSMEVPSATSTTTAASWDLSVVAGGEW